MTGKRFERVYGDVEVVCIDHNETGDDRFFDDGDYDKFVEVLNSQDMHIFLLKCVIQTITAESYEKDLSSKRIMEIKNYWYEKIKNEVLV